MWQLDGTGANLVYMSDSFLQMLGMTMEQVTGGGWLERVPSPDRERFLAAWEARDPERIFEGEYRIRGANGKVY